jgi:Ca2+-binding EF-hand superfamily protein
MTQRREHLFILRLWQEAGAPGRAGQPATAALWDEGWRGSVQHVPSGERATFVHPTHFHEFVRSQLARSSYGEAVKTGRQEKPMMSEFQQRKIKRMFDMWDVDRDGVLGEDDARTIVANIARVFGVDVASPAYAELYETQMATLAQLQQIADANGDGRITAAEHLAFWQTALAANAQATIEGMAASYRSFWKNVDPAGGDDTTLERWTRYLSAHDIPASAAQTAFDHCDTDHDGVLSPEEAVRAIAEYFGDDPQAPGNWFLGEL